MTNLEIRKLVESAARLISLNPDDALWSSKDGLVWVQDVDGQRVEKRWNPINDDGDAFRLAVRYSICIEFKWCEDDAPIVICGLHDEENKPRYAKFPDPNAATRLAIVIAAARIFETQSLYIGSI